MTLDAEYFNSISQQASLSFSCYLRRVCSWDANKAMPSQVRRVSSATKPKPLRWMTFAFALDGSDSLGACALGRALPKLSKKTFAISLFLRVTVFSQTIAVARYVRM